MHIHLIWAQDANAAIGKAGTLPWHYPEDLKNFKKLTLNSAIVMGRKTWESLPFKPLPKRRNIVLSRKNRTDVETYDEINKCLKVLEYDSVKNLFIIGGRSIYNSFYPKASTLHLTMIDIETDGIDTFFPISMNQIKKDFNQIEEKNLDKNVTYYQWRKK